MDIQAPAADILLCLGDSPTPAEDRVAMKTDTKFTLPQIRYWLVSILLVVGGASAAIWGDHIPWDWLHPIAKELGPGIFTAGILACLVEPFFRAEFARDAFLAAFRYVLPNEFRDEIAKILRFEFIAEKQLWTVKIDKVDEDTVLVTTTFEKTIVNKSKSTRERGGYYAVPDLRFKHGQTQILDCTAQDQIERVEKYTVKTLEDAVEARTKPLRVQPNQELKLTGKATQYRRISDLIYETFLTPAINPEIEVIVTDDFEIKVEFGTEGDVIKSRYAERRTLSGIYFPGQCMIVRWWPKQPPQSQGPRFQPPTT
jgi:hypothetical protein